MEVLITNEEWDALLGIKPVPDVAGAPSSRTNRRGSGIIRSRYRMMPIETTPTLSLRDIISNEEIAALLTVFATEPMEAMMVETGKTIAHKHSHTDILRR
jgi:hypothetical protein